VEPATPPPELGQHTDTVLRQWLALQEADILALRQSGAIT
jgi:crotonobetainyl-CoA:carnitine CoA-transferase CaiB-like acyl-CoA transferase